MSIFNDKALKSVADAVSKVLANESSHASEPKSDKEKKLAAMAHPKDKITHKDVLVGRGVLKKEEAEQLDELSKDTLSSYLKKRGSMVYPRSKNNKGNENMARAVNKISQKVAKEDVEQVENEMLQEGFADMEKYMKAKAAPQPSGGAGMKQGSRYGGGKQAPDVEDDEEDKKPARGKYGARQNYKRSVKEGFTGLINAYNHGGLKGLSENLVEEEILEEEPDNEQFTKELEDQKASMSGKKKQPSVAAPSTQGVKQMPEEVEVQEEVKDEYARKVDKYLRKKYNKMNKEDVELNADEINGVSVETIDERTLTPDEKSEMEKNVKGMKKKLSGFKQRYGERAKEVMYATATKMAKKD